MPSITVVRRHSLSRTTSSETNSIYENIIKYHTIGSTCSSTSIKYSTKQSAKLQTWKEIILGVLIKKNTFESKNQTTKQNMLG